MTLPTYDKIARNFADARENAGKTQAQVADYLGVTYQAVSNWEHGRSKIDSVSLLRALLWFNVDIYQFLSNCDFDIMTHVNSGSADLEHRLMEDFCSLDLNGQSKVADYANDLVRSGVYSRAKRTKIG